jgi:MinD-like ATPase involved in chromosome partitioning or flagellar assembly
MKTQIKKIKEIIAKTGNLMAGVVNPESSINYGNLGDNITALIEEYEQNGVNIVIYDCRSGNEIDDFYVNYNELTSDILHEILEYLQNYLDQEEKTMNRCKSYNY